MSVRALAARRGAVLAAPVLVMAAGVAVPAPAHAAACTTGSGVTVVVDHNELGGGVAEVCVGGGGGDSAAALLEAAGYPLTYAQRDPGFVCRVRGLPQDDPCVVASATDAHWALYWSDATSGSWTYATLGAPSLTIPAGGYVGLSWQGSSATSPPSATPGVSDPASDPATLAPDGPDDTDNMADTAPTAAEPEDGGLPTWVPLGAVALLAVVAGATAVLRRRAGSS